MQYNNPYMQEEEGCGCCPYGMWQSYYNNPINYNPMNYDPMIGQNPMMGINPIMRNSGFPCQNYREESFNEIFNDGDNVEAEEEDEVQVYSGVIEDSGASENPVPVDVPNVEDKVREIGEDSEEGPRNKNDVDRVIRTLDRKLRPVYNEILRAGVDKKVLNYMVYTMVNYIDRNYNKYKGTLDMKVNAAEADIKIRYPFIHDLLRIYNVSPATQMRFFDGVIRTSFEELRRIPPKPMPPPPPGPMPK